MLIDFQAPESDKEYFSRLLEFIKRNMKYYVLDFFFLFMLIIPPYNISKTLLIIVFLLILSIRDIFLMRLSKLFIQHFKISDDKLYFTVYKYSKCFKEYEFNISDVEIDSYEVLDFKILRISKNKASVFKQFPIGYWTNDKIEELLYKIDYQKRQIAIKKMF